MYFLYNSYTQKCKNNFHASTGTGFNKKDDKKKFETKPWRNEINIQNKGNKFLTNPRSSGIPARPDQFNQFNPSCSTELPNQYYRSVCTTVSGDEGG